MEADLASRVYNFIFDCKGGDIELLDLIRHESPMKGFTEARATEILSSSEQEDPETKQKKKTFAMGVNSEGRKTVRVSCKARICFGYLSNGRCSLGEKCRNLHICRGFLEENCHDEMCSRSHNLLDKGNKNKLQKLDCRIVRRPKSTIKTLISKNLPYICRNYLNNQCKNDLCQNLHLCSRFVRDVCCSEENGCPLQLSHDLTSSHNKKIYKKFQVPENYLKCNTLLPRGIKVEKLGNVERAQRSKITPMMRNNLDRDDDSDQRAVKSIGFTRNISLDKEDSGCHCSATSLTELRRNGCSQHSYTEDADSGLDETQTNPISVGPSPHPRSSKLQNWASIGCFKMASSSSPTCAPDGQSGLRPSRSVGGKESATKVGMTINVSNETQAKPVIWVGRGRGRPSPQICLPTQGHPGQVVQPTTSEQSKIPESFKMERVKAVKNSLLDQTEMTRGIFNCILTKFNGTARFSDISFSTDPVFLFSSVEEKDKWFRERNSSFLIIESNQGSIEEVKTISPKAKMCLNYLGKSAYCGSKRCLYFHICKDYLANGKCSQPAKCPRNHGFHDGHNKKLASELFPGVKLTVEQLRQMIKSSTPQVCMAYNERKCFGSGLQCKKIHVCKNYVSGNNCKRSCILLHERGLLTPETKKIVAWLKVTTNAKELLRTLLICNDATMYTVFDNDDEDDDCEEAEIVSSDFNEEMGKRLPVNLYSINASSIENHICMKFLLKQCKEGNSCADHHCPMPYQWVYLVDNKWQMFSESQNINLEKNFCNEGIEDNQLVYLSLNCPSFFGSDVSAPRWLQVNFSRMEVRVQIMNFPLKRLSTESEVNYPDCPLATKWRWFVKGSDGKLKEYGQEKQMDSSASVQVPHQKLKDKTSDAIEKHYLEGHSKYDYEMEGQRLRIYFKKTPMHQRTVHSSSASTREEVERRPLFVSQEDFDAIKSKPCMLPEANTRPLPSTWTKMAECQDHLLVQLPSNSKEYQEMESLFLTSMPDKLVTICSINRIQNSFLWEKYTRKKDQMKKMAARKNDDPQHVVYERLLFHATSHRNIRRICKQNFDWRSYGEGVPKIYGDGVYFSKDSSLSHWFCTSDDEDGSRYIFISKVLVGSYTEGRKRYRHPPPRDTLDPNSEAFDSCADRVNDPQVFVVFDVDQYYPGYLVEYRTRDSLDADLQTCCVQ